MKKLFTTLLASLAVTCVMAQGWPANYGGVMLQGFYWDYYNNSEEMGENGWATWTGLESHASELEGYIDLIWVPNSARTKNDWCVDNGYLKDMGYMPCWWLNHDNTIFGNTSELKSMISTYKSKGIGIIEDVVINHKNGENDWCDFPDEKYPEENPQYVLNWSYADICRNDNGGYVSTMFNITGANDTGDDFDGCRDLDHTSTHVQQNVITYLNYLKDELGYTGFRYDMVKGYGPQYVGIYNSTVEPKFSVGEFWDNWDGTTWWINGTKQNGVVQSAAFDFPLKFLINNAFTGNFNQSALNTQGLAGSNEFQRYSVTFVDNHDTYRDGSCMSNEKHVLAANAFILSMPGTPCIFLPHWKTHKDALKRMIKARKVAGVNNQSTFDSYECNSGSGRSFVVHGTNADILLLLGDCGSYDTSGYSSVWNGDVNNWDFQMYVSNSVADALNSRVRVDMASGTYYQSVKVNVSPTDNSTTLVYTENGTDPTTSSSTITSSGLEFTYDVVGTHTLKVGVKDGESVKDIQTYTYTITDQQITDITIYVRADKNPIYLYAWDATNTLTSGWPGTKLSDMKSIDGVNFYYMSFPKSSASYQLNYILSQGGDETKTQNQEGIASDIFTALGDKDVIDLSSYSNEPIESPVYKDITVYVKATQGGMKLHAWNANGDLTSGEEKLNDVILVNDCAWYRKTFTNQNLISFLVYHDDIGTYKSNDFTNVTSDIFVTYNGSNTDLTDNTDSYSGYTPAWYEEGEICAFFVNYAWDSNKNINAYVWKKWDENNTTEYVGSWPGAACTPLGYNEHGGRIWKWNYNGTSLPEGTQIIFTNKDNGSDQLADCEFVNGAWYDTSNTGEHTSPVSTAVTPSTEISVAALGTPTTATNWNGKSEKVAQKQSNETISKTFSLAAGSYTVQAIVRGTSGSTLTLSAKGQSNEVNLNGLDGTASTVQTNGIVETYATGTNNGWLKAEVSFTLESAEVVTVELTSAAATWQLGALKVVPGTTKTKATTGVDLQNNAYIDVRGVSEFSFFERGDNPNALIKAAANTLPALLPYNVIVGNTCANLKLTDGNYSFKNAGDAFTATNVSYDRGFTVDQTSTVCLPFALTAEEAAAAGTFWALEGYAADELSFVEVTEPEANTPYLFDPATANPFSSLTNKEIPTTSSLTVSVDGISFVGVSERTNLKSVENSVTYYGYQKGAFVQVGTGNGVWINPFRAYLMTPAQSGARINVLLDGEMTGIKYVVPVVEPKGEQPVYNLSGQRVQTPSKKGIYIKGGKKFVIK